MGILGLGERHKVPRLDFELTPGCDHACGHCYNVWNAEGDDPQAGYPRGVLPADRFLAMMDKAISQSGADHITITGGEPMLHKGAMAIIERACSLVGTVQIITNGSHVTPERARKFREWGVRSVQLTLLSADRGRHDRLKGAECFDDTLRAAVDLLAAKVPVQVCFVAMHENWRDFEGVMELCFALGVRAVSYNRMSPTGGAIHHVARLVPTVEAIEHNLDAAERLGKQWRIRVATAMPIPPCLIRLERYQWVSFGFCSIGSASPNITIDAMGNVRSCNLSSNMLGNIVDQQWPEIHGQAYLHTFKKKVPQVCRGCHYETSCQGGCKESGFAVFGDLRHPEPLLHLAKNPGWRDDVAQDVPQAAVPLAALSLAGR